MDKTDFELWFERLGKSWSSLDPKAAASLFSKDCEYYESALQEPCRSWDDILKLWSVVPNNQKEVTFEFEVIGIANESCISNWKVTRILMPNNQKQIIDGVFQISLNKQGLCNYFKQWRTIKDL